MLQAEIITDNLVRILERNIYRAKSSKSLWKINLQDWEGVEAAL